MAVLDAGVAALRAHQPVAREGDEFVCACRWKGTLGAFERHIVAGILSAGFSTSNPDELRSLAAEEEPREPRFTECAACGGPGQRYDPPGGAFWSHLEHPADGHNFDPLPHSA